MVGSQLVIGRTFDATAYVIWALLCLPAVLLLLFHRPGEKPGRSATEGDRSGDARRKKAPDRESGAHSAMPEWGRSLAVWYSPWIFSAWRWVLW